MHDSAWGLVPQPPSWAGRVHARVQQASPQSATDPITHSSTPSSPPRRTQVLQGLSLGEDVEGFAVLQGGHQQGRAGPVAAGQLQGLLVALQPHGLQHRHHVQPVPARTLL